MSGRVVVVISRSCTQSLECWPKPFLPFPHMSGSVAMGTPKVWLDGSSLMGSHNPQRGRTLGPHRHACCRVGGRRIAKRLRRESGH